MNDPSAASGAAGADLPFRSIAELIREHARAAPRHPALVDSSSTLDYGSLDALMDRVAASLQRDGVAAGDSIAICAVNSTRYAAIFLGALRAGVVVAPLAASVTPASFRSMLADAGARLLFVDASADAVLGGDDAGLPRRISLDGKASGTAFDAWLAAAGSAPHAVEIRPEMAFNIIYSSGTTGTPKGIVQPHGMRWTHVMRGGRFGYSRETVTLLATPLYSNTTLVVFFPTIAFGGTVVLMEKFDVDRYLALAERHRVTPHDAGAGAVPAADGEPALRRARPVVVPDEVLHQRAVRRGAQGRRRRALARRPGRVLRHDRGRRHLHPRRARASRQAAHRRPARPKATTSASSTRPAASCRAARPARSSATRRE